MGITPGAYVPQEVNDAFDLTCPELESKFARYPIQYLHWYGLDEVFEKKGKPKQPMFVASETDEGIKLDYVFCKRGPKGKGYYHFLTKISYVNLLTRISANPPSRLGIFSGGSANKNRPTLDAWDTTKRVIYTRTRLSTPDDSMAFQTIDHMTQTKLNPLHGITG